MSREQQGPFRRFLRWCWEDLRSGATVDLWLLVFASIAFTFLGAVGVVNVQVLSSVVLSLLALLAISQLRGRQELRSLVSSWKADRTALFLTTFPQDYYTARAAASHSYAFAGISMLRTLPTMRPDLVRILDNGGDVRLLLPNPANGPLMDMVAASRQYRETPSDMASAITQTLQTALRIRGAAGGTAEVRITELLPRVGLNLIDIDQSDGLAMVQMYQASPTAEPGPIFLLTDQDGPWLEHFRDEFERLWARASIFA